MERKGKIATGVTLLAVGTGLICWTLRDPDRAYREGPRQHRTVTAQQIPLPVQAAVQRVAAGQKIEKIREKQQHGVTTYDVDATRGDQKAEFKIAEDGSILKHKSKKVKKPNPAKTPPRQRPPTPAGT